MAVYTQVPAETLAEFLTRFDVGELVSAKGIAEGVENSNFLVETTGGRFILTLYEKRVAADDLPFFMALLNHLAGEGQPVPPAVPDRNGREIHELQGRPACLIQFLPGVSVSHPTAGQARAAGRAMGAMHGALTGFSGWRPNSMGVDSWKPLFERCGSALDQIRPGLYGQAEAMVDHVLGHWPSADALPRAAIHADLFPDNVLMLGETVTGLIDFYFACTDFRAYDLAVMHTAWSFDADGRNWSAEIGDSLVKGYYERFALSEAEHAALPILAMGSCLRFFLSRAWDWLNTPADAMVTRKDPIAYLNRYRHYAEGRARFA
ncbi:MAG: homoserine kinase [Sphingomonas sp.]|nr:homoserine kinase [Sphingomonas sp.]